MSIKNNFGIKNAELDVLLDVSHFTQEDIDRLHQMKSMIEPKLPLLTDNFYKQLQGNPITAVYLEGRIDALKATHIEWMKGLFSVHFNEEYIKTLWDIGRVHARLEIPPLFVSASMSFLRSEFPKFITLEDAEKLGHSQVDLIASVLKILDINHFVIDGSYYDGLLEFTGISKKLLHKLMS
ncbi:MAG: protoglobin domain-containing protein [Wohlfahrtiimonas sp.]